MEKEFPKFLISEPGTITVSETFYSIQGEGRYIGTPAIFLRTQGCLLNCIWCDTYNVWKSGKVYTYSELIELWKNYGYFDSYKQTHIILTGGEPLARIEELYNFILHLKTLYYKELFWTPFIEVETAATALPGKLRTFIDYYNVSPKLRSSGMNEDRRIRPEVLKFFSDLPDHKVSFKFVVKDRNDVEEAFETYIKPYQLFFKDIYLMAEAQTRQELQEREPGIVELAKKYGFKYSTRLHLHVWDKATGV